MALPPAITIRAATPADASAILELHRASILALGRSHYTQAEVESWAAGLVVERYTQIMESGEEAYIVAETAGGTLAGFCSFRNNEVVGLYVAPGWARRGVGSVLLQRAEAVIGATHRLIRIGASLSGRRFYEVHGYAVTAGRKWQSRGGLVMDAVDMEKSLPPP